MPTLCFFGTYDRETPRFRMLNAAWPGPVVEAHAGLWPGAGERARLAPSGGLAGWALRWARAQARLWAQRRKLAEADIVLVTYPGHLDMPLARLLAWWYRKPLVFDAFISLYDTAVVDRGLFGPGSFRGRLALGLDRLALRLADRVLADTAPHADYFAALGGISRAGVAVVPLGADEKLFYPREGRLSREVLFFGRMIPLHGVETVLEAARLLAPEGVRFTLAGAGQVPVDELIARFGLENVERLNAVAYADMPALIASARVCLGIFGTSEKAFRVVPYKVYEAAAMGKAIVTADTPAMREAFPEGGPLLVPAGNGAALAEALRGLLADPARQRALGEATLARFAEAFSVTALRERLPAAVGLVLDRS